MQRFSVTMDLGSLRLWIAAAGLTPVRPRGLTARGLACIASYSSRAGKPGSEAARLPGPWCYLPFSSSSSMPRNCSSAVSRLSTISCARTAGSGRLLESYEHSFSAKDQLGSNRHLETIHLFK
jgi:hypothetical protein